MFRFTALLGMPSSSSTPASPFQVCCALVYLGVTMSTLSLWALCNIRISRQFVDSILPDGFIDKYLGKSQRWPIRGHVPRVISLSFAPEMRWHSARQRVQGYRPVSICIARSCAFIRSKLQNSNVWVFLNDAQFCRDTSRIRWMTSLRSVTLIMIISRSDINLSETASFDDKTRRQMHRRAQSSPGYPTQHRGRRHWAPRNAAVPNCDRSEDQDIREYLNNQHNLYLISFDTDPLLGIPLGEGKTHRRVHRNADPAMHLASCVSFDSSLACIPYGRTVV